MSEEQKVTGATLHCRLRHLMGERENMRIQELSDATGLQRNTISSLYNDKATRIDYKTVALICTALRCTPGDLFVLVHE